jgi:hypothetical protein
VKEVSGEGVSGVREVGGLVGRRVVDRLEGEVGGSQKELVVIYTNDFVNIMHIHKALESDPFSLIKALKR